MWQISYPSANGASQGNYFLPKSNKLDNWGQVCHRRTDRQTNYLTPYTGVCGFFLSVKFATSHTRFARRGIIPPTNGASSGRYLRSENVKIYNNVNFCCAQMTMEIGPQ